MMSPGYVEVPRGGTFATKSRVGPGASSTQRNSTRKHTLCCGGGRRIGRKAKQLFRLGQLLQVAEWILSGVDLHLSSFDLLHTLAQDSNSVPLSSTDARGPSIEEATKTDVGDVDAGLSLAPLRKLSNLYVLLVRDMVKFCD